jgi:hypothetical protein
MTTAAAGRPTTAGTLVTAGKGNSLDARNSGEVSNRRITAGASAGIEY